MAAWPKLKVKLGEVEVAETIESQTVNGLPCHLDDVELSPRDKREQLGGSSTTPALSRR